MNPDNIPPQLLAALLQNPQIAQLLQLQGGGMPPQPHGGMPQLGGQGGMPPPVGGQAMGLMPQPGMPTRPY